MSILYKGEKLLEHSSVQLPSGRISSIRTASTKFLGGYIGLSRSVTTQSASSRLLKTASKALGEIDKQPIRGEYKCWILKHYLAPSLHFYLAINEVPEETIKLAATNPVSEQDCQKMAQPPLVWPATTAAKFLKLYIDTTELSLRLPGNNGRTKVFES